MNFSANPIIEQTRRHFFGNAGLSLGSIGLASLMSGPKIFAAKTADAKNPRLTNPLAPQDGHHSPRAKNVIYLFMAGAPSQLDLFITWLLQLEEGRVRTLESLLTVRMDDNGKSWAQLVSDWDRVLGT